MSGEPEEFLRAKAYLKAHTDCFLKIRELNGQLTDRFANPNPDQIKQDISKLEEKKQMVRDDIQKEFGVGIKELKEQVRQHEKIKNVRSGSGSQANQGEVPESAYEDVYRQQPAKRQHPRNRGKTI